MDWTQVVQQADCLFKGLHDLHVKFYKTMDKQRFPDLEMVFWYIAYNVPWIVWFIIKKKQSTDRLLYAGFSVIADVLVS